MSHTKKAFITGPHGNKDEYEKATLLLAQHNIDAIHEYSIYENTDVASMDADTAADIRKKAVQSCKLLILLPDYNTNKFAKQDIENADARGLKCQQIEKYLALEK